MDKYYITEEAFEKIFLYLKNRPDIYCKTPEKTRTFLESIYFIMRTGAQWAEIPKSYGKHKTIHKRFYLGQKKIFGMRHFPFLLKVVM